MRTSLVLQVGHDEIIEQTFDLCDTLPEHGQGTKGSSALHVGNTLSTLGGSAVIKTDHCCSKCCYFCLYFILSWDIFLSKTVISVFF